MKHYNDLDTEAVMTGAVHVCLFPSYSLALNRFKDFLMSDLLVSMYSDAISGLGSKSAELPYALMEASSIQSVTQSLSLSLHISRQDAFLEVMQTLANVVCRYAQLGTNDPLPDHSQG